MKVASFYQNVFVCHGISFKIHQLIKLCLLISKHQSISILQQWQRQVGPLKRMLVILYQRMSPMRYVLFLQYNIYNYRRFLCTIISVHIMFAQFILVVQQYTLQYNHQSHPPNIHCTSLILFNIYTNTILYINHHPSDSTSTTFHQINLYSNRSPPTTTRRQCQHGHFTILFSLYQIYNTSHYQRFTPCQISI